MSNDRLMARGAARILRYGFPLAMAGRGVYRRIVRPVTVGVRAMVIHDGNVLLVRTHGSQHWDMPGGGVKRSESLRTAAMREAREETGCTVEAERLLGVYLSIHEGMSNHVAVFVCRPMSRPSLSWNVEIAEARYWPLDTLPQVGAPLRRRLSEYEAGAHGLDTAW